jgi:hypothetical protein
MYCWWHRFSLSIVSVVRCVLTMILIKDWYNPMYPAMYRYFGCEELRRLIGFLVMQDVATQLFLLMKNIQLVERANDCTAKISFIMYLMVPLTILMNLARAEQYGVLGQCPLFSIFVSQWMGCASTVCMETYLTLQRCEYVKKGDNGVAVHDVV